MKKSSLNIVEQIDSVKSIMILLAKELDSLRNGVVGNVGTEWTQSVGKVVSFKKKFNHSISPNETFIFKSASDTVSDNLKEMYNVLNGNGFIRCTLSRFKYIFGKEAMRTHGKVRWLKSQPTLKYLIDELYPLLKNSKNYKWSTTLNCFSGNFSTNGQISKAGRITERQKHIIDNSIRFLKNS